MTNTPGDEPTQPQQPQQPSQDPSGQQPGYGEQQPPQGSPYGEQQYTPQYGQQPGYQPAYAADHPKATTALILGILGIVVCGFVAPFAWRIGKRTVDEIDASQGRLGGRGSAQAGYILGLIGTVLLGLGLLFLIGFLVLAIFSTVSSSTTSY